MLQLARCRWAPADHSQHPHADPGGGSFGAAGPLGPLQNPEDLDFEVDSLAKLATETGTPTSPSPKTGRVPNQGGGLPRGRAPAILTSRSPNGATPQASIAARTIWSTCR